MSERPRPAARRSDGPASRGRDTRGRTAPTSLSDLPPPPPGRAGWPWTEASAPPPDLGATSWPTIGILTPSYNQGRFLEATIRSVLLQGYPHLEYVIEDGGSTDRSVEIVRRYEPFLTAWDSTPGRGQSEAINAGFARLHRARWLNWLNSDDVLLPGALFAVGRGALANPDAAALVGAGVARDTGGQVLYSKTPREDLDGDSLRDWWRYSFMQPACFFSHDRFEEVGGVDESLDFAMDFDLWVRLAKVGAFVRLEERLAEVLVHPDAKTQVALASCMAETCEVLFRHGHAEDGRRFVRKMYERLQYVEGLLAPVTESRLYRWLLRPLARRVFGAPQLRD